MKPADIIGVLGNIFFSKAVTWAAGDGLISHVGLVLCTDPLAIVIESVNPEVRTIPLDQAIQHHTRVFLMKALTLTDEERKTIIREACKWSAADYSFAKCIWTQLDEVTKSTWFSEHMPSSENPECAWMVSEAYKAAGKYFGGTTSTYNGPNTILRFAQSHPQFFQVLKLKDDNPSA